jgi:Cu+-exporting ATPase
VEPVVEVGASPADSSAHSDVRKEMQDAGVEGQGTEIDPVCGMSVDPATTDLRSELKGLTYYFCSAGCKSSFDREPDKYLGGARVRHGGA